MGLWRDVGAGHQVQVLHAEVGAGGAVPVLWEHDCPVGYPVSRHQVSPTGAHWTVISEDPLTLTPSLHCDPARGGCGAHGFVTSGRWS